MATKPTIANARWATAMGAHLTDPAASRDLGFQPSTPAVAGHVNTMLHELYLWALYVDEGEFSGDVVFGGTVTFDSDVDMTGNTVINGPLVVENEAEFNEDVTVNADLEATFLYHTGQEMTVLSAAESFVAGDPTDHPIDTNGTWRVVDGTTSKIVFPIHLPAGAVIEGYGLRVAKAAGDQMVVEVVTTSGSFSNSAIDSASSSLTGNLTITPGTTPSITVPLLQPLAFVVSISGGGSFTSGDKVGYLYIIWTKPKP